MNYVSDCCGAPAVEGTLNTWNNYSWEDREHVLHDSPELVTYGTCSKCKEPSLFSEGE